MNGTLAFFLVMLIFLIPYYSLLAIAKTLREIAEDIHGIRLTEAGKVFYPNDRIPDEHKQKEIEK